MMPARSAADSRLPGKASAKREFSRGKIESQQLEGETKSRFFVVPNIRDSSE